MNFPTESQGVNPVVTEVPVEGLKTYLSSPVLIAPKITPRVIILNPLIECSSAADGECGNVDIFPGAALLCSLMRPQYRAQYPARGGAPRTELREQLRGQRPAEPD